MTYEPLRGEVPIRTYNLGFAITSCRLVFEEEAGFDADFFSVPLIDVGFCEVKLRSNPWLLSITCFVALAGLIYMPTMLPRGDYLVVTGWLILVGILAASFQRSRKAVMTMHLGSACRKFRFPGGDIASVKDFIRTIHQAREDYTKHLLSTGRGVEMARLASELHAADLHSRADTRQSL